jgi:aspartyl-tRNA(Asn)/glutamyl-tRNA(Gln) amidotransferase subunit C
MSTLSHDDITHLAHLSRLELTDEEQERFAAQLSNVVEYVDQLSSVVTPENMVVTGVSGLVNVLAPDQVRAENDLCNVATEELLAGSPLHAEGFIQVKAVMAAEEGGA